MSILFDEDTVFIKGGYLCIKYQDKYRKIKLESNILLISISTSGKTIIIVYRSNIMVRITNDRLVYRYAINHEDTIKSFFLDSDDIITFITDTNTIIVHEFETRRSCKFHCILPINFIKAYSFDNILVVTNNHIIFKLVRYDGNVYNIAKESCINIKIKHETVFYVYMYMGDVYYMTRVGEIYKIVDNKHVLCIDFGMVIYSGYFDPYTCVLEMQMCTSDGDWYRVTKHLDIS